MISKLFNKKETDSVQPFIISGPCSVETPEQLFQTVEALYEEGVRVFRGGVWKPRTRPGTFEGVGTKALPWIKEVKQEFDIEFAIEVASARHVEEALNVGIDILWIGARSTVNPFTVQEIADSLEGVDVPVLIKNPINPDLGLWLGAFERIHAAGIEQTAAIHRGFSNFREKVYRNSPNWQIPIDFRSELPQIPMICDPSHISGKRQLVPIVSQKALDLNFDGLMIESHINPNEAWSDSDQQLSPKALGLMIRSLQTRKVHFEEKDKQQKLNEIRDQIDQADHDLLEAIHQRMALVEKIGEFKKLNNVAVLDMDRWKHILQTRPDWAREMSLNPTMIEEMFGLIHQESIKRQTEIIDPKN
ncbi:bifunctional 3-deoxy-7-phosphoheptulonate synthase/chorismate mutase type II [Algoriphagus sediminis]|uniref:chorismate mutase n=1 Tax=Algoriphagus sediminis TaxID=3057113 RepID=A0ABT7Y873_9BACT|nr:bifunctional 3-deoxy-7-phosphoheptulonate synthase/chorismate mutase type II [Algoriphagus sediminis]MDN3202675.1 bifunctional 3-deoxy-7-phosphoheptulonate synthase/chorismate mutase type II [Algoriphagus sediminis]